MCCLKHVLFAGVSPLPDRTGFQSSLPNPASHEELSASPRILVPAAFPAGGAVDTKGRYTHGINELHPDQAHEAGTPPGGGEEWKCTAAVRLHKGCPGHQEGASLSENPAA